MQIKRKEEYPMRKSATATENAVKNRNPLTRLRRGPWPLEPEYDRRRQLWCVALMLVSVFCLEFISLYWTARRFTGLLATFLSAPLMLLLNLLPLALLVAIFYALTGKVTVSVAVPGVTLLALTLVNAFKINLRGDPFVFSDFFLASEAGDMMGRYSLVFSKSQIAGLIAAVLGLVLLSLLTGKIRLRGHWLARGLTAGGCAAALVLLVLFVYPNENLYKTTYAGAGLISTRNSAQWYAAHGFTYAFLNSAIDEDDVSDLFSSDSVDIGEPVSADEPDGDETAAEAAGDTANVNILAIQLEAYCDMTHYLDPEAVEEVYASFHAIEEDAISGNLLVNINGGGTVNTERSVITGYTALPDFTTEPNSYAWYLQSIGYTVEGSHPNDGSFYDRDLINANLGFETYYFNENYYEEIINADTAILDSDAALFEEIVYLMEEADGPYFSLNITLQNHGPYDSTSCSGTEYLTEEDCANETIRTITNNYLNLIASTNEALADMVEELSELDEPVLLVVFGDHMPYLGDYTSLDAYEELGINADVSTDEGFYNYYSTPYFIWANDAAREALGQDCVGDGGDIGPYFLMNKVFELCGWTGDEMMQASNDLLDAGITMVSSAVEVYCEIGQLVDTLSEEGQTALDKFLAFQSAWQSSFQYGDLSTSSADESGSQDSDLEE